MDNHLVGLLKEARDIIRASASRQLAKDWDRRATAALRRARDAAGEAIVPVGSLVEYGPKGGMFAWLSGPMDLAVGSYLYVPKGHRCVASEAGSVS